MSDIPDRRRPPARATALLLLFSLFLVTAGIAGIATAQQEETEPNDGRVAATPVTVDTNSTTQVEGELEFLGEDWFAFDAQAGEKLVVDYSGPAGIARLRGPDGTDLDFDSPTITRLNATAPETGMYYLQLSTVGFAHGEYSMAISRQRPTETSIDYLNCTAARITGDFDRVHISAEFNVESGVDVGSTELRRTDLTETNGSVVVRSLWSGLNGSVLNSVTAFDENYERLAHLGNEAQTAQCYRQIRPDVNFSVVSVTEVTPGTYNVTFGYTNTHNDSLLVYSPSLRGRVSDINDQVPPDRLESGQQTFSVEWSPVNDSERLTWQVGFNGSWAGYDQPVTVETAPASQYRAGTESKTLRIEAPSDAEVFSYQIRVDGDAELGAAANTETEDSITDNGDGTVTIRGTLGFGSADSYELTGDILCGSLGGPGETLIDGQRRQIDPCDTSSEPVQTLRIEAHPDAELFLYTVHVEGDAELGGAANPATTDSVTRRSDESVIIRGTVGLGSGDTYEFRGEILCVSLGGPGDVLVDGQRRSFDACQS